MRFSSFSKGQQLWVVILMGLTIYSILGFDWLMLCFCVFWQTVVVANIARNVKVLWKTRKGIFVHGHLIKSTERNNREGYKIYKVAVRFEMPGTGEEKIIHHESAYPPHDHYHIWLDTSDPTASIITNNNAAIILNNLFFVAVVLGLCVVDYFYLVEILKK